EGEEEGGELLLALGGELGEASGGGGALAVVQEDRLGNGGGPAVVEVGGGVGEAPQGRGLPLVIGSGRGGVGDRGGSGGGGSGPGAEGDVRAGVNEPGAHVVQEEVAVDPLDRREVGDVTGGAADRSEGACAGLDP